MQAIARSGPRPGGARRGIVLVAVLGLAACGGRPGPGGDLADGAARDDGAAVDAAARDARRPDGALPADAGTDPCNCTVDSPLDQPTYQYGECVPPLQLGCPAVACTPGGTDCGEGYTCDEWGAAACCYCAAARPACLFTGPAMGPLPEYLKLSTTYGPAFQDQELSIEGFPFYVGALFYDVLVRDGTAERHLSSTEGGRCSLTVKLPGQGPGTVTVWVSQYGGDPPWVLAGFFTFSTGDVPGCAQPGFSCAYQECCTSAAAPMACAAGRCRSSN